MRRHRLVKSKLFYLEVLIAICTQFRHLENNRACTKENTAIQIHCLFSSPQSSRGANFAFTFDFVFYVRNFPQENSPKNGIYYRYFWTKALWIVKMSRSYASQSGARPRRRLNNDRVLQQERGGISDEQEDESTQPEQTDPQANERSQRYTALILLLAVYSCDYKPYLLKYFCTHI